MKEEKPQVNINIQFNDHDITVVDIDHEDNSITMTREEATWLYYKLSKILGGYSCH